jgi:indolepyruvate ferredoxin oxidoreductase
VTGVGGTGVCTIGALITMAAHLEGKDASVLDFMGFSQKGGAVLSFVRLSSHSRDLHQARIDVQQADAVLACDMVVGASAEALQTIKRGHTRILLNTHEIPTAAFATNPDAAMHAGGLTNKLRFAAGPDRVTSCNAKDIAQQLLGDTLMTNVLMLGFAWQRGLIPVSLSALERAIELNAVSVAANKAALAAGRLAAFDPKRLQTLAGMQAAEPAAASAVRSVPELIEHRAALLMKYQDSDLAQEYRRFVKRVQRRETDVFGAEAPLLVTRAVAHHYAKLLAYKDEYEVARLYTDGEFMQQMERQFDGNFKLKFHVVPPWRRRSPGKGGVVRKMTLGSWMMLGFKILAKGRVLRGTPFDIFGYTEERRCERQLIADYVAQIEKLLPKLSRENLAVMVEIASIPERIRGYGHVKLASIAAGKRRLSELLAKLEATGTDNTGLLRKASYVGTGSSTGLSSAIT